MIRLNLELLRILNSVLMCLSADQIGFCLHLDILLAFFINKAFEQTWCNILVWIQKTTTTPPPFALY